MLDEDASAVKVRVTCAALQTGASYRLERRSARSDDNPLWSEDIEAAGGRVEKELTVEANRAARFHCVAL